MGETPEHPLAIGYRSASRLNLQHYLWKQEQGYLLHPSIFCNQERSLKIADIGTGTGIWLLDLSNSLPKTVQLHGFDADLSHCPPKPWLPDNVSMRKLDMNGEIPEDLVGQYDIIHIRFFLRVVRDNDPTDIIKKAMKMLRRHGWIQWTEQDLKTCRVERAFIDAETKHTEALKDFMLSPTPQWPADHGSWVASLRSTLKDVGLDHVVEERKRRTSWNTSNFEDITILELEEMSSKVPDTAKVQEMIQKAAQEFEKNRRGVTITSDRVTVVGRKR